MQNNDDNNDITYRLRAATKRADLPADVIRLLGSAYAEILAQESTILRLESQYSVQHNRAEIMEKERNAFRTERDDARMEVCELSGNGSCDSAEREAESRGWQYLYVSQDTTYVCDHCAAVVDSNDAFHYAELPRDIASANKGESATLCRKCEEMIDADENNEYFKKNHR